MLQLNFDPFPILTTERLVLRKPCLSDDGETFLLRSDKEHNRYVDRPLAETVDDARQFLRKLIDGIDKNEWISWVITRKGDDKLIGSIGFWNIDKEKGVAETGFELAAAYRGQGIMQEAVQAALDYGLGEMRLAVIEGWVHKDNERSARLMGKFGFERDEHAEAQHAGKEYFKNMQIYTLKRK